MTDHLLSEFETRSTSLHDELGHFISRRAVIDERHARIARLLQEVGCDGVLIQEPTNFRWLTAGAEPRGLIGREERPALYFSDQMRWLLCSSIDSQRFFDEELDSLGFQLKEWSWMHSREKLLSEMVYTRKFAGDVPFKDGKVLGPFLIQERRVLNDWEQGILSQLGRQLAHALEATARDFRAGETEDEIAGQIAHRLYKHGIEPLGIEVHGDGRSGEYTRRGVRALAVNHWAVLQATGRWRGLHVTAARTVSIGQPAKELLDAYAMAHRLCAAQLHLATVNDRMNRVYDVAKQFLKDTAWEHDWRKYPAVIFTGRDSIEQILSPTNAAGWKEYGGVLFQQRLADSILMDTYLLDFSGWKLVTTAQDWPIRMAILNGKKYPKADMLIR
ncbi:MAG: M24 family metallopeptidase [Zavarzinella sp.]